MTEDEKLDEILQPLDDNGWHENRGARIDCGHCKNLTEAKLAIKRMLLESQIDAYDQALYESGYVDGGSGPITTKMVRDSRAKLKAALDQLNSTEGK